MIYPNVILLAVFITLKLFDVWSTNYIVGRKGGSEAKWTLTYWLIKWFGVQPGLLFDFLITAYVGWFLYPYLPALFAILAIQCVVTSNQWREFKKSQTKQ